MNFQGVVLLIAIIILIVCLILIGLALKDSKKNSQFPPVMSDCPDYWKVITGPPDDDGKTQVIGCQNVDGLPVDGQKAPDIRYDGGGWTYTTKQKFANDYKITWDGISTTNKNN